MNWREEAGLELSRGLDALRKGNEGRARTSARRAAGVAFTELQKRKPDKVYGRDAVEQLRGFAADLSNPLNAREAAERLQARLTPQFKSPSTDPLEDARIVIDAIANLME